MVSFVSSRKHEVTLRVGDQSDKIPSRPIFGGNMASQIDELVRMRDLDTLYELMTEDDEWLTQLDAAEGLVQLGDRRGYEFLLSAMMSEDE